MNHVTVLALVGIVLVGFPAAEVNGADSALELQVRSNIVDGFNLPPNSSFNSKTPSLAEDGQVAVSLSVVGGDVNTVGLWLGGDGSGSVVWSDNSGAFVSDCSLNESGLAVFELSFITPDGIYHYDASDGSSGLLTDRPLGTSGWGSPQVNATDQLGYRASFLGDYAWVSWDGDSDVQVHAAVEGVDAMSPYWYLYTPAFNDLRQIAGKASLVSDNAADQIIRCQPSGPCTVIAEDQTSNPGSPYTGFANSVGFDNLGRVAFKATTDDGEEGVYLSDGTTTVVIATTASAEIGSFEGFAPRSNNLGQVVFRAIDGAGLQAIFVGDGVELRKVVTEHDVVPTDLGPGRVDQHDTSTVFGGNPVINDRGDVAFIASLTPEGDNQIEWGSGLFVAPGGQIFGDGFESGGFSAWSSTTP
jgi:hypothetical protein